MPKNTKKNTKQVSKGQVTKLVKQIIAKNQELKFWWKTLASTSQDYNGLCYDLTLIPQGDTDATRDGDRVVVKHLSIKGYVTGVGQTAITRVVVLQWYPNTVPTQGTILFVTGNADSVNSPYTPDYIPRDSRNGSGKILYDKRIQIDYNGAPNGICNRLFEFETSRLAPELQYVSGSTAGQNHLYVLLMSDKVTSNLPTMAFISEVRYTDA